MRTIMNRRRIVRTLLPACALLALTLAPARGDELRNLKRGEPIPTYHLPTIDETAVDDASMKGSVVVMVFLSAEQRSSELAALDARDVVIALKDPSVKLVHVTADVVQKAYFERFRKDRGIEVPLVFDADRTLYARLGLIVFPTTIIVDTQGRLADVISLHGPEYKQILDARVQHTMGKLTDEQLAERLKARASVDSSPKSLASAHRSAARFLREKGQNEAARAELAKALEQDPSNSDILLDLADLDMLGGDLDAAEKMLATVLEQQPDNRRAKQLRGIALYKRGKFDEAEAVLLDALVLNPDPTRVHYFLGRIYENKAQPAKAAEHYREALKKFLHETGD
jgi:Tfp pilus assembly protein PilF/peroxiredoxin